MAYLDQIEPQTEVVGADGVHVGTVDYAVAGRIKLTRKGSADDRHHFVSAGLICGLEDGKVRLSANAADALMAEEENDVGRGLE